MTISNEQIQTLQAAAEKATPGKWWIDSHGNALVSFIGNEVETIFVTDGEQMGSATRHEDTGNLSHWRNDNDATFIATANPAVILSLLAKLEADKALIAEQAKSIDFLKEQLAQLANFNPDWDKLEAATDSLREHMAELTEANKRIAELESQRQLAFMACNRWADKFREAEAKLEARTLTVELQSAYDLVGDEDGNCNLNEARMEQCDGGCYLRRRDVEQA